MRNCSNNARNSSGGPREPSRMMGVAPPPAWGRLSSIQPRAFGGNLDNKELGAGAKLFLPVFVPGALFSCGDGHGVQGDGEVCITAIETALQGRFAFRVRKDLRLKYPRAETASHYITMYMDPDLDRCAENAVRDMIVLLGEKRNLSREDAYTLCSLAADIEALQQDFAEIEFELHHARTIDEAIVERAMTPDELLH